MDTLTRGSRSCIIETGESFLQAFDQRLVCLAIVAEKLDAARLTALERLLNAQHAIQETHELVFVELEGSGFVHQGCRCDVGKTRSRSFDFGALTITSRPNPGQGKVMELNIKCTYQFPMNDQLGMSMS